MNAEVQLARTEGRRLLRHPAVWLAVAAMVPWVLSDWDGAGDSRYLLLVGFALVLPGFVMMTVTILAVLRGRMSRTDGLLETLPVGPDRRTVGHGLSTIATAVVALTVTVAVLIVLRPQNSLGVMSLDTLPFNIEVPRPNMALLLQGPFAVAAVCAVSVAFVRWIPTWLVALPLLFGAAFQFTMTGTWFGAETNASNWWFPLATGVVNDDWVGCSDTDPSCLLPVAGFDQTTPWWHLGYLVAVAVFGVVVAVLKHRRDRVLWTAFAITGALVVLLAGIQAAVFERYEPGMLTR
jgi:hypothetical protein